MKRPARLALHALTVVGLLLSAVSWSLAAQPTLAVASNCTGFGNGVSPSSDPAANARIKEFFKAACDRFANDIVGPKGEVHWWNWNLVQDFYGKGGDKPDGAIFYDFFHWQGASGTSAYMMRGVLLAEYWNNPQWGPVRADVAPAPASPPNGVRTSPTTGFVAKFGETSDIWVYYNGNTKGTYVVSDVALTTYRELGGPAGLLGYPEGPGLGARPSGYDNGQSQGFYQNFENGIMHTWNNHGKWEAHPVNGAIQAVYNSLAGIGSGSALGFPLSNEIAIAGNNASVQGVYQTFQGGRVYYDGGVSEVTVGGKTYAKGGPGGTTYVLYNDAVNALPDKNTLGGTSTSGGLGFPIEGQANKDDYPVFFQLGYMIKGGSRFRYGDGEFARPPLPKDLILPYTGGQGVNFIGGPHGNNTTVATPTISVTEGSGIDFGKSVQGGLLDAAREFEVRSMTSGTVVWAGPGFGFGNVVAIRSQENGTVIAYCHLKDDSWWVERNANGKTTHTTLKVGMFVTQAERIATTYATGRAGMAIHLHVELRTGRGTRANFFGAPLSWQSPDAVLSNPETGGTRYQIYGYTELNDPNTIRNYEGTAIRLDGTSNDSVERIQSYYADAGGQAQALIPVRRGALDLFAKAHCEKNPEKSCEDNSINDGWTIFAVLKGQLQGLSVDGDGPQAINTPRELISTDPSVTVSYDPNFLTLASPSLGAYIPPVTLLLPSIAKNVAPGYVAPTPTPIPTPAPTATPETPGPISLSSSEFNNGGFEDGSMNGWTTVNGTVDVDGSFVHTGSYSVHGSNGGNTSSGQPPVSFYRDYQLFPYQFWVEAGRLQVSSSGWFQNGDAEDYRMLVTFRDAAGVDLGSFDTGWRHDPGESYVQVADYNRAVPVGTTAIRYEVQIRRNSGSYTDVDVDDLMLQLSFANP